VQTIASCTQGNPNAGRAATKDTSLTGSVRNVVDYRYITKTIKGAVATRATAILRPACRLASGPIYSPDLTAGRVHAHFEPTLVALAAPVRTHRCRAWDRSLLCIIGH